MFRDLCNRDGSLILWARSLRTFGYGFLSVVLGVYLSLINLDAVQIGSLFTIALLGSAALTILFALIADKWGRRKVLVLCSVLMAVSGILFVISDNFWVLVFASLTGTISATSGEVGPFLSLEQAILPQTSDDRKRTRLFAIYNLLGTFSGAVGALFAGLVSFVAALLLTNPEVVAPRFLLAVYSGLAVINLIIFLRLSPAIEVTVTPVARPFLGLHKSRKTVYKLAALFWVDAFAGGFIVQSLVAYWFSLKFGLRLDALGFIFFGANLMSALSFLLAEPLAKKIGLINTMVFTHLPSNVLLMFVPLMPNAPLAIALLLVRQGLSQMDVPTRQSYTMAVVEPDERTAAAAFTSVARNVATASSPVLAGLAFQSAALGLPFFLAGGLKIAYDLTLWVTFRQAKPPEELADLEAKKSKAV
jgi:MFS family permease